METNFFQSLIALQVAGDWNITIARETGDRLVVSVLFYNTSVGDDARKKLPPLIFRGTAAQIDEAFFDKIDQPVKETAQLYTSMQQYLKGQEQARAKMNREKDKGAGKDADNPEKELKDPKVKKYEEALKKVEELEKEGKYREAWVKVPEPGDYPEHAEELRARRTSLSQKFAPSFFNNEP